jgi:hypothetical protein
LERRQVIAAKTQVSKMASVMIPELRYGWKLENVQYLVLSMCMPVRLVMAVNDPPSTDSHMIKNTIETYLLLLKTARTRKKKRRAVDDTAM